MQIDYHLCSNLIENAYSEFNNKKGIRQIQFIQFLQSNWAELLKMLMFWLDIESIKSKTKDLLE